jgi:phenylacetaldehyde dehydrogenase
MVMANTHLPPIRSGLAPIVTQEVFGPVLTMQPFDTEEEAAALANSTEFGIASGIQTQIIARAHRVAGKRRAGIVWVNGWALLNPTVPFGGVKNSGWGMEFGAEPLSSYTTTESVVISVLGGES